jgi:hypothetical protein
LGCREKSGAAPPADFAGLAAMAPDGTLKLVTPGR